MSVAAIVLAAGSSSRFGDADKLLAPYRGKPLALHAAAAVRALEAATPIAVISNPALRPLFAGFDIVALTDARGGQSASIRAGVARARRSAPEKLLIVLADMPCVTTALLQRVVDAATPERPAAASDGQHAMPPACFPASYLERLAGLDGDAGARSVIRALPRSSLIIAPAADLLDVDRIADLDPDA